MNDCVLVGGPQCGVVARDVPHDWSIIRFHQAGTISLYHRIGEFLFLYNCTRDMAAGTLTPLALFN